MTKQEITAMYQWVANQKKRMDREDDAFIQKYLKEHPECAQTAQEEE